MNVLALPDALTVLALSRAMREQVRRSNSLRSKAETKRADEDSEAGLACAKQTDLRIKREAEARRLKADKCRN